MLLDKPALKLNIGVQDILEILEQTLKQKNWNNFDVASLKLLYIPFYLFNYDTLIEVEGQPYSQGFSGLMAMNAVTGELKEYEYSLDRKKIIGIVNSRFNIKDSSVIYLSGGNFIVRRDVFQDTELFDERFERSRLRYIGSPGAYF